MFYNYMYSSMPFFYMCRFMQSLLLIIFEFLKKKLKEWEISMEKNPINILK